MAISYRKKLREAVRGIGSRQIRLGCGLVLFAYLISHFLDHALGNISVAAMQAGIYYHIAFWQFPPVAIVFYSAALAHSGLGIWALYQRRQFHWKAVEPLQLVLGLSIPLLVLSHIVGVRVGHALFDLEKLYPQELYAFWTKPPKALQISIVLIVAWVHGCLGLHFWLRMKAFYRHVSAVLFAAAVLVPTLALLGFYQGGREISAASLDPQWQAANLSEHNFGTPAQAQTLEAILDYALSGYLGLIALALLARGARELRERLGGMITLTYGNGRTVRVPRGLSVLEASLRHNVPHASVCGGRARCSTCRIRVIGDCSSLPEPSQREAFVLSRVGTVDPSIRLACQLRPTRDLTFFQLFTPGPTSARGARTRPARIGQERYLVCMFVDMRGSTQLAEHRLPFDTVFIVNRFLEAVSRAVIPCGGQPNQLLGDGMLALFGLASDAHEACRGAMRATAAVAANIEELNRALAHDLRDPIRFGIGIHGGEVIVGDIGYRDHIVFTALGDAVNVAARLQDMTKGLSCEVAVSEEVCAMADIAGDGLPRHQVAIRGRAEPMTVRAIAYAKAMADLVDRLDAVEGATA